MKVKRDEKRFLILWLTQEEKKRRWEEEEEELSLCRWSVSSVQTTKYKPVLFLSPACFSDDEILTSSPRETSWINNNNNTFIPHSVSGSFHPHQTESHSVKNGLNCSRFFSMLRIFLALRRGKQRCTEKERVGERVMAVRGTERLTELPRQAVCEIWGPGALWMAHAEWVPWWGDQAHWEQVTRGRECFCSAFGPLTYCPTSALAALKLNIFICNALKREGGAAVRIKSSSCWQLHLLLKGSYDRRTMSLRRPALQQRTVICGHAGNIATISPPSPLPSSLDTPELFLWPY